MSIKMIADRIVYRANEATEYKKGESFMVDTEKEADRLIKMRRAHRAGEDAPKIPPAPRRGRTPTTERAANFTTKVMTPEPPLAAPPAPPAESAASPAPAADAASSEGQAAAPVTAGTHRGRYNRSDLRSED
ncbi:MAG: hypothetical protein MK097_03135 [Dechloromonas sp.]|nr:hypothetical protein [Dechloromonas sp.]